MRRMRNLGQAFLELRIRRVVQQPEKEVLNPQLSAESCVTRIATSGVSLTPVENCRASAKQAIKKTLDWRGKSGGIGAYN